MKTKRLYIDGSGRDYIDVPAQPLGSEIASRFRSTGNLFTLGALLPNPDPILRKKGLQIDAYKELLSDAHLGGALASRKAGTLSKDWYVNGEEADPRATALVDRAFRALPIKRAASEILQAVPFGFQPLEVIWERSEDGFWLPSRIPAKPVEWFAFDLDNHLRFRSKDSGLDGEEVPPFKFLVAQHNPDYNNPYGDPILSRCFWPISFKRGGVRFYLSFAEKYGTPWALAKYPRGYDKKQIQELVDLVDGMIQDAVIALPQDTEAQILAPSSTSSDIYQGLIAWCNEEVSKAILGHTGSLDSTPGKLGAEDAAIQARADLTHTDQGIVEDTLSQLAAWITEINFGAGVKAPRFEMYVKGDIAKARADRDQVLFAMGWRPTPQYLEKTFSFVEGDFTLKEEVAGGGGGELRGSVGGSAQIATLQADYYSGKIPREAAIANLITIFGLDPAEATGLFPEVKTTVLTDPAAQTSGGGLFSEHRPCPRCFSDPAPPTPGAQGAISDLPETLPADMLQSQMEKALAPVLQYLSGEVSFEEARDNLADLFPKMDTGELEAVLAEQIFIAQTIGRIEANGDQH